MAKGEGKSQKKGKGRMKVTGHSTRLDPLGLRVHSKGDGGRRSGDQLASETTHAYREGGLCWFMWSQVITEEQTSKTSYSRSA